jgi:cholesterol transport system auxiliary component
MTRWSGVLSVGGLVSCSLALVGCIHLNKSYPEKRTFVLDVTSEAEPQAPDSTVVLKVRKFRVSTSFAGRAMVYRIGELQYETDFYDEWLVPPSTLVTEQVHDWMARTGRYGVVLAGSNHVEPTHLLEGTVTEFYGDYRSANPFKAMLGIELRLLEAADAGHVILRRTYHQEVPLSDRSPDGLAAGLTQALRLVLVDFERALAGVVTEPSRTPTSR